MRTDSKNRLIEAFKLHFPQLAEYPEEVTRAFRLKNVDSKTILLSEGEKAQYLFFVLKGCMRIYFIRNDGREVTAQFFFEGQMVGSMESIFRNIPSKMYLESLEESELAVIRIDDFSEIVKKHASLREMMLLLLKNRLLYYAGLYISFITLSPEERYIRLIEEYPGILNRVSHHYIATYLGITPVSLSRIRNRLAKNPR